MLVFAHRSTIPTTSTPQYHYQCAAGRLVIWNVISVGGMPNCQCVRHACLVTWPQPPVMQFELFFSSVILQCSFFCVCVYGFWWSQLSFSLNTIRQCAFFFSSLHTFLFQSEVKPLPFFFLLKKKKKRKKNWKHQTLLCCVFSCTYLFSFIKNIILLCSAECIDIWYFTVINKAAS